MIKTGKIRGGDMKHARQKIKNTGSFSTSINILNLFKMYIREPLICGWAGLKWH
jgi:hypothetical protein